MRNRTHSRSAGLFALGAVLGAAGFLAVAADALAGPDKSARRRRAAVVGRVDSPLGLQGSRGAGARVQIPFTLIDASRALTDVQSQYGIARRVKVSDNPPTYDYVADEWFDLAEDRLDSHNSRRNRNPQLFVTAGDIGATHNMVWDSIANIRADRYETSIYQFTDQGRPVPDAAHPGEFLFDDSVQGVIVRMRAVRGRGRRRVVGDWTQCDVFSINNNTKPEMSIDQVIPNATGTASDEDVEILWTVRDADSEDLNNNDLFDPGEDRNGNNQLDREQVGVAFDYYRVQPGENPLSMSDEELLALPWGQCTRTASMGDTDSFRETNPAKQIVATPSGRQWKFVWDSVADVGTIRDKFILRARSIDSKKENSDYVYLRQSFTLDNWKIFASGGAGSPEIRLASGRVGTSATNLVYGLERSDGRYLKPLQEVVVAGGAATDGGAPVRTLEVLLFNAETANTSSATPVQFVSLANARKFHSATALPDGRVLFAGGFDDTGNPTTSTEIYDPATRSISAGPDLVRARARHAAVLLSTSDVAFIGGVGAGDQLLDSVEVYHFRAPVKPAPGQPDTGTPDNVPNTELALKLAVPQHSAHAVLLPDQTVLIAGGIAGAPDASGNGVQTAQLLDPFAESVDAGVPGGIKTKIAGIETVGSMGAERKLAAATALLDGNVLFTGGYGAGQALSSMEIFNVETGEFEPVLGTLPGGARSAHVAQLLGDGSVIVAGGATGNPALDATPTTASAGVVRITTRDLVTGNWSFQALPLNGELHVARRGASATVLMSGRAFIVGGADATGAGTPLCEVYTPENSVNTPPKAYVYLSSPDLSHRFGAPVAYRLYDKEGDRARVQVQFRAPGDSVWNACTSQDTTIADDVAEPTAGLTTTTQDIPGDVLQIDPVAHNTTGDHLFIWAMAEDIDRPGTGEELPGYNLRVIPYGAVRGVDAVSQPVTVLFNTKPIVHLLPLEDATGTVTADQGGDIDLVIHVRDIDGDASAEGPHPGDVCDVYFEYAEDKNGDGQIIGDDGEDFRRMTPAGEATEWAGASANPFEGVTSWSEAYDSPDSDPDTRPADKGWATFTWDALYDLGPPPSPTFRRNNIWIRVTAIDANIGFPTIFRNKPGQPDEFVYVRDNEALWMERFQPRGGRTDAQGRFLSAVNEPIDLYFNGNVDADSVNAASIQVFRRLSATTTSTILGVFQVRNDTPSAGKSIVTFYPQVQELDEGAPVHSDGTSSTILFPSNEYRFVLPGYNAGRDPEDFSVATVRPLGQTVGEGFYSTFQLVHSAVNDGDADATYRFLTVPGTYDDGQTPAYVGGSAVPSFGTSLSGSAASGVFTMTFSHALDSTTLQAPNLRVTAAGPAGVTPVVPGSWSVTNVLNSDGTSTATLKFIPFFKLPSGGTLYVDTGAGLLGSNGRTAGAAQLGSFLVDAYGRHDTSVTETFSTTTLNDTSYTTAIWGNDPCAPGRLTGSQDGSTPPQGGSDLVVTTANSPVQLQGNVYDYRSITVQKGAVLRLRSTNGPMIIRTTGDITIDGTVDMRGLDGDCGGFGLTSGTYYYYYGYQYTGTVSTSSGVRNGGTPYNGGGGGGASKFASSDAIVGENGAAGSGTSGTGGQGGRIPGLTPRNTTYYYYGAGGGAGGGHARDGYDGGPPSTYSSGPNTNVGLASIRGLATSTPADFSAGITAGGGGGGGGAAQYANSYFYTAGAGGAGAGAVTFVCNGTFTVSASGYIDARGGEGGTKNHYSGSGGGGAGGAVWIKAGTGAKLDGVINLRGGRGGPPGYTYYADTYSGYSTMTSYGTSRFGGDGGLGRLVVEAPNFVAGATDHVRVFGALMVRQVSALPTTSIGTSSVPGGFTNGGTVDLGSTTDVRYSNLTINSGITVRLRNNAGQTLSNSTYDKAARIWVDGNVTINGALLLNGNGSYGLISITDIEPYNSSEVSTMSSSTSYLTSGTGYQKGYNGVLGGGDGGQAWGNTSVSGAYRAIMAGTDGKGPSPGKIQYKTGHGWNTYYEMGDGGGSGAGNASAGIKGWAPYAAWGGWNYKGAATDTKGNGVTAAQRETDASLGGAVLDARTISTTTFGSFAGSGGGGGNGGYYSSYPYVGIAAPGGGGGGALAIICQGTISIGNGGRIEAKGGSGAHPGCAYYPYTHSGSGGGSGGTIYLAGNTVSIAPAGSESFSSGATFDLSGGPGGGFRQPFAGTRQRFPWYNSFAAFGGDGGYGRLVVDYKTSLNGGKALANRWGYEQSAFTDSFNQYLALAGQATFKCRGVPGYTNYRSQFVDLGSIRPVVNSLTATVGSQTVLVLQGQGAQSHPNNPGPSGLGVPDSTNVSPIVTGAASNMNIDGWRWGRFLGTISRLTAIPSDPAPTADDVTVGYTTDN